MKSRQFFYYAFLCCSVLLQTACCKYGYRTFENDPTETRLYTLDNGLKVYMSVNKDRPRIEAHIAVRVGGKNDPAETTGLAHYFEHLMFKGTDKFGTTDYEAEKPLLDSIEAAFEVYRKTTDPDMRLEIYGKIDSLSYVASGYAIPNEYDKLMAAIGAQGTNAYTGNDQTVYTENIPSNQVENWCKIQAERFQNPVIRLFHTELETVYEEKNMSLTQDSRKVFERAFEALYPNHPYGTQTILGTQEHLKNPSITNIKEYYRTWYVPNNIAICMCGDLDPDKTIRLIDKYFGSWAPNNELPQLSFPVPEKLTATKRIEVLGNESPNITLAWQAPGMNSKETMVYNILCEVLYNGVCGLVDLDLLQTQKILGFVGGQYGLAEHAPFIMRGYPKEGQKLEEVRDLMLLELNKLRTGNFDSTMMRSIINNYELSIMSALENNRSIVDLLVDAHVNNMDWQQCVDNFTKIDKVTKNDITEFACKYLLDNNYVEVYKLQGVDPEQKTIAKPHITPIQTNRDSASAYLTAIQNSDVPPIEPVFVDFEKDLEIHHIYADSVELLYKQNTCNGRFTLSYRYDYGSDSNNSLGIANSYLSYLGTDSLSPDEINRQFYALACNWNLSIGADRSALTISGLARNMEPAMRLVEHILYNAQPDEDILSQLKADILRSRADNKLNQSANFSALQQYLIYGPQPAKEVLANKQIQKLTSKGLLDALRFLFDCAQTITYYGPLSAEDVSASICSIHRIPAEPVNEFKGLEYQKYPMQKVTENSVTIAPYPAKQIYMYAYSNNGREYDAGMQPIITLYNEYFGGGMNGIVFQEMREARGLAYTARSGVNSPSRLGRNYTFYRYIATQNDKMMDALRAFDQITDSMPQSDKAFNLAKENLLTSLRTGRTIKESVISSYLSCRDLGLTEPLNRMMYEKIQGYTLQDIVDFQQKYITGRKYHIGILGTAKELDLKSLEKEYGPITHVTAEQIFGY